MRVLKIILKGSLFLALLPFSACRFQENHAPPPSNVAVASTQPVSTSPLFSISPAQAVTAARPYLLAESENNTSITVCDAGLYYRVINIPLRKEVSVSRIDGKVLDKRTLVSDIPPVETLLDKALPLSEEDAIAIAREQFVAYAREKLGANENVLDHYHGSACDTLDSWRVSFILDEIRSLKSVEDVARLPNFTAPDFLIDKASGRIQYFNYLQR
jgi:hypothetical protein